MPHLSPIAWSLLSLAAIAALGFAITAVRAWRLPATNRGREHGLVVSVGLAIAAGCAALSTWANDRSDLHEAASGAGRGALIVVAAYLLGRSPLGRR